jgi:hypothetical protein
VTSIYIARIAALPTGLFGAQQNEIFITVPRDEIRIVRVDVYSPEDQAGSPVTRVVVWTTHDLAGGSGTTITVGAARDPDVERVARQIAGDLVCSSDDADVDILWICGTDGWTRHHGKRPTRELLDFPDPPDG